VTSSAVETEIVSALRRVVRGLVDDSTRVRAEYATDASNYRVIPQVVVFPRDTEDVLATLETARTLGVPVTSRGAGTSCAGNAVGTGVIIDFSRHLRRIYDIDPEAKTARVDPGVVMSDLQAAARPHGLRFGPDPSTQNRATFGGMIGNNACGPRAVAYGRTADNVLAMDVIDGMGRRFTAAQSLDPVPGLAKLVTANLATIRTELGRFRRQVSGYSLEHLLPESGTDLAKMLVGTEGTLVTVLGATLQLVDIPAAPVLVALGYPSMPDAADVVPALLAHDVLAIEGLDAGLIDVVRRAKGAHRVPELPEGEGYLLIEVGGATDAEALAAAQRLVKDAGTNAVRIMPAGPEATAVWQIRADGAGLAGRTASGQQAWPGWEDAAVPPENLGAYLREFNDLMASHRVDGLAFGHFGDGCVHVRINFPLAAGSSRMRAFLTDAAHLVAEHGGSLSGEHGDGRARSELLPIMYSPDAINTFRAVKNLFDPDNTLNPGVLVDPRPLDADLRRPAAHPLGRFGFSFKDDDGDMTNAVHRCVGVGKCRVESGGFMCPSYRATKDEKDVTRGRARVLQEMANGSLFGSTRPTAEVLEALDLCLSCKACGSECPAGVDMAMYRSETLYRHYRGKPRPLNHYALGMLPRWGRLIAFAPRLVNLFLGIRPLAKLVLGIAGLDTRRTIPPFTTYTFRAWVAKNQKPGGMLDAVPNDERPRVMLWTDSFSDTMAPAGAEAAVAVLMAAGYKVLFPDKVACCGLTWISTGQLSGAKRQLTNLLDVLGPVAEAGIPIIGVEPSCTSVLRSDLVELLPDDPRAEAVRDHTFTIAELLTGRTPLGKPDWELPDLSDVNAIVQPHCHQHAVISYDADLELLAEAGATVTALSGCCGLAGNFGMEKGHYEISVAVAEQELLPALRDRKPGTIYLADGYSCRTQASQLAGVDGMTVPQLIASRLA
jgi:FAD/FMN-containing dehydrogenase/Fe-S oxidoreductase